MNPVVKGQLDQFMKANKDVKLSESDAFEVLTIHAVENGVLTESIDPFAAHLIGNEFGIDGIAILIQGEICTNADEAEAALSTGKKHVVEFHFFQSKTSDNLDYGHLSKFFDGVVAFIDGDFPDPSIQIQELSEVKDLVYSQALKRNPNIRCFFAYTGTGEVGRESKKLIEATEARLESKSLFDEIEIGIMGAKEIQTGYRSASNSITASIEIEKYITLPRHPSVAEAFLGVISAEELLKLISVDSSLDEPRRINKAVFYDNIRDYDSGSTINNDILAEINDNEQDSFVFKNNGITVVAKEINRTSDQFNLDNYQIVNGCQTSNIIFAAGEKSKGVSIPFRLIGSQDNDFISSIIVGTNRQNQVRDDQFWALRPFMKDLEEFCGAQDGDQRLFIERRENQFREEDVERTRIVKPSDLMKSIAAMFLFQPNRAARDYRGIRSEFERRIFLPEHSVEVYHAAAYTNYRFEFFVRNRKIDRSWRIYKYFVLYALGYEEANNSDIFALSQKKQSKAARAISKTSGNDADYLEHIEDCCTALDSLVAKAGLRTREQVRDYIRSESIVPLFIKEVYGSEPEPG